MCLPRLSLPVRPISALSLLIAALVATALQAAPPLGDDKEWKLDVIHRKGGRAPLRGLITRKTATHVHLKRVFHRRGHPTVILSDRVPIAQVKEIVPLKPADHEALKERIDTIAKERKVLAARLKLSKGEHVELPPDQRVTLVPTFWAGDEKRKALSYESSYFTLISNAREDIVQLTAIQLEEIFAAFSRHLPAQVESPKRTTIVLARSLADYYEYQAKLLRLRRPQALNPAFYHPNSRTVVCGSDLERLSAEIEKTCKEHAKLDGEIKKRIAKLTQIYGGRGVPEELLLPLNRATKEIHLAQRKNNEMFAESHRRLYQRIHHEAFHAYLDNAVAVGKSRQIPIWLNEGLAQIFETAIVEAGDVRVGHADPSRRNRIREQVKLKRLMPLRRLLKASPREFQVAHAAKQQVSNDYYLTSWGLAFYLTFELQIIGTPELEDYAKALSEGADPQKAFEELVGKPLAAFESDFHDYLDRLKLDGMAA